MCYNSGMTAFQEDLTIRGAELDAGRVVAVTSAEEEYRSFQQGLSLLVPLLGSSVLHVTGADRLDFVHGQVSNDVKRLKPGEASEGLLLNHKGHALAGLRVLRSDDLFVVTDGDAGTFVQKQLNDHIIFDAVKLELLDAVVLTLQGTPAADLVKNVFDADAPSGSAFATTPFQDREVMIVPVRRSLPGGFDMIVPREVIELFFEAFTAAGAVAAGEKALNLARVSAGIPAAEFEGGEGILPQEAGLEHAVSYTKGCYLGQEIMARIEARGKLRRLLQGLKLAKLPDPDDRDIIAGGKIVGRLGTAVEHPDGVVVALAVLRNNLEPETLLEVGGAKGRLEPLPFTSNES